LQSAARQCGVCGTDDRANGTFSSSCSRTSSSVDFDRTSRDSTSNLDDDQSTHLHPSVSPNHHLHQQSSEWSEASSDPRHVSPRSPSYPYSSRSSADDSEPATGSTPPQPVTQPQMLNVFDLPSAADANQQAARKHLLHTPTTPG